MITCDAVIDETKTVPTKTVTKKSTFCKVLYVTSFLLITMALLIVLIGSIYFF